MKKFKGVTAALRKNKEIKICENVGPMYSSVTFGSKNHITKGLYAGYDRVALKKIGKVEEGDPRLFNLRKELKFVKKLNKCNNIVNM
jgi:hypothetical protein